MASSNCLNSDNDLINAILKANIDNLRYRNTLLKELKIHPDDLQELRRQLGPHLTRKIAYDGFDRFDGIDLIEDINAPRFPRVPNPANTGEPYGKETNLETFG